MTEPLLTEAQRGALKWLKNRGGDGVFDRTQCLVARGERAGVMRSTWAILERAGMIERYQDNRRARLTKRGEVVDLTLAAEADCA